MAVAPDGRLWATAGDRIGVHDGIAWTDVLVAPEVRPVPEEDLGGFQQPLRVAPDGSAWLWDSAGMFVLDASLGR